MGHNLQIPLISTDQFRHREVLCWTLAFVLILPALGGIFALLFVDIGLSPAVLLFIVPATLWSGFPMWHARRLGEVRARLRTMGWDEQQARLLTLHGRRLTDALAALKGATGHPESGPLFPRENAIVQIHDGMSVMLRAEDGLVKSATVSLQTDIAEVDASGLGRAVILTGVFALIDGFTFGFPFFSVFMWPGLLFIWLPLTMLPRFAGRRYRRLRNIAVYLLAAPISCAAIWCNNRIAEGRADALVAAVKTYHATHGRYPKSLEELVPEIISHVPSPHYSLLGARFSYQPDERSESGVETAVLSYHESIYIRRCYSFQDNGWRRRGWR
jgi:hypothetical protein